ncbi:GNAT family N-acetyltransferase [Streptantibioticus rubrisoli]|uniref:Lysine N-acyltransferase MbtK n=1 Tax=Streptantibioticus rubrisoli TaxID=1387313 RepID=A0ABT1P7L2_9ACTN|nr:GNAT family N-acetyltransferase [Streptantibioticus rubrisoli]MCQ4040756.1 acetyltransferase [Streptantibioticus rubrisoli]
MTDVVFNRTDERLGRFAVRPVDPATDTELLHRWVTHPKSVFWMMQDAQPADVRREFEAIDADPHHDALLGLYEDRPAFLVERYDPTHSELAGRYAVRPGDVGMHFLVAPTDTPIPGFTRAVLTTVMELLFSDPANQRVVVEPDIRNHAVHALNAAVGFRVVRTIALPDKHAHLSTCTRQQYLAAREGAATVAAEATQ